ncbi:MAG: pseudouridine synthase [Gammaproteobacteria bacterium]|jgi:tRNA pseudouridine32 synthase/23S rRNA pseudouridine746 synthase|nr:pseudouridine synthase [Gammaproteobacteria bacterium]
MASKPLGVSRVRLPAGGWSTVLAYLCQHFSNIAPEVWRTRFLQQKILNELYQPIALDAPFVPGATVYYFRELSAEPEVPFQEQVLFEDEHLLVVDKPHFLATAPVGNYVEQTVLRRLQRRLHIPELVAAHRLDRLTAGVLLLVKRAQDRDAYQRLFREQAVEKTYEAIAPALPQLTFPYTHLSQLQADPECFFLMREVGGAPNSQTRIEVLKQGPIYWHYALYPVTGRKHQLRVHLASLGAPIVGDDFYPQLTTSQQDNYQRPLQLLARSLRFIDPLTGQLRFFSSARQLMNIEHIAETCY